MNLSNEGNVKIVTIILSLIGITAFVVNQGVQIENQPKSILGGFSNLEKNYNEAKTKYIDQPLSFVEDSKRKVDELEIMKTEETPKVLSIQTQKTNSSTEPRKNLINTLPETKISKLTSQMVENCKIITDEYNKLNEGNQ